MNSLTVELLEILAVQKVEINDEALTVDISDGRTISLPLSWYPRLIHGSEAERSNYKLIGNGSGIHWNDLDEDISIQNLIIGQP